MSDYNPDELTRIEFIISDGSAKLEQAKQYVRNWINASTELTRNAAQARAKNQAQGRGIGAAFLGSKYRAAVRFSAASSNAAIAKEVAKKRAQIAEGKMKAQAQVRRIQIELAKAKERRRELIALSKSTSKTKAAVVKGTTDSNVLLKKLKEAYELGLLTEQEYEEKRKKLVSNI